MTNAEILNNVALIRDAVNPGENSAQRVGSTLEGIAQLAINNENKIKTLEGNENSTQDSIDILNSYFTQNQGEDGKLSLNRWNMAYYLNEAMVWGGDIDGYRRVTTSEALLSKNPGCEKSFTLMSGMYTSLKNVYFTATDYIHSDGFVASKGDIILSTGTRWTTLISTHPRKEYSYTNPDMILFEFYKNEDEFVHYMFNNNYTGYNIFNVTTDISDTTNKMTFYVLVTNNSTKDITFNLPYNQVLVIPQGKERYFEAKIIDGRYVFAFPPLSDTESNISINGDITTIKNDTNTLKSYFTSTEGGTDNNPTVQNASINRWNLPFYLVNALIYGGTMSKGSAKDKFKISLSNGLRNKNKYKVNEFEIEFFELPNDYKNVYFYVTEPLFFNSVQYHKDDLIISTGSNWYPIHNGNLIKHTEASSTEYIEYSTTENIDEHMYVKFDNTYPFDYADIHPMEHADIEPCKNIHFYFTNQSGKNITLNFYKDSTNYNSIVLQADSTSIITSRVYNNEIIYSEEYNLGELNDKISTVNNKIDNFSIKSDYFNITANFPYKSNLYKGGVISIIDTDLKSWKIDFLIPKAGAFPQFNISTECSILPKNILLFDYSASQFIGMNPIESDTTLEKDDIISVERFGDKISITLIRKF